MGKIFYFLVFLSLSCSTSDKLSRKKIYHEIFVLDVVHADEILSKIRRSQIDYNDYIFMENSSNDFLDSLAHETHVLYSNIYSFQSRMVHLIGNAEDYAEAIECISTNVQSGNSICVNIEKINSRKILYKNSSYIVVKVPNDKLSDFFRVRLSRKANLLGYSYVFTHVCFN